MNESEVKYLKSIKKQKSALLIFSIMIISIAFLWSPTISQTFEKKIHEVKRARESLLLNLQADTDRELVMKQIIVKDSESIIELMNLIKFGATTLLSLSLMGYGVILLSGFFTRKRIIRAFETKTEKLQNM